MCSIYYEENLSKCKSKQDRFLKSQKFLKLPKKWQAVIESIFKTIIASPYLYCNKSNRTLAEETNVSPRLVNQVRLWLHENGLVSILTQKNGNRANRRYLLQMACMADKELVLSRMSFAEQERYRVILGLSTNELTQAGLDELLNFNEYLLSDSCNLKEQRKEENYYVYNLDAADSEYLEKESLSFIPENIPSIVSEEVLLAGGSVLVGCEVEKVDTSMLDRMILEAKGIEDFVSLSMKEKSQILEFAGFMTVPANGKMMYRGHDYLSRIGSKGRVDLVDKVNVAFNSMSWQEFYSQRMGKEKFDRLMESTFGNSEWMLRKKHFAWNYEYYRDYTNLGVVMRKGTVCIDIDIKDRNLLNLFLSFIPGALVQETPRGYHIFCKDPHGTLTGVSNLGENVDVKGFKSHVVVSDIENRYKFIDGDFNNLPSLDRDFLRAISPYIVSDVFDCFKVSETDSVSEKFNVSAVTFRGKFKLPDFLHVSERNRTLMRYSFHLRARGFSAEVIEREIRTRAFDKKYIEEPLLEKEVKGIMKQVQKRKNSPDFIQLVPMWSINDASLI